MTPQLLLAGHIVKDVTGGSSSMQWRPGGGVLYAAVQAARLGVETAAVTSCPEDIDPALLAPDVAWHTVTRDAGLTFHNTYDGGARRQRVHGTPAPLTHADIPAQWLDAPAVLLTPVFHDVDEALPARLSGNRRVGLAAQGWLRSVDGDIVKASRVDPSPAWLHGDVVFVSDEDVLEPDAVETWQQDGLIVVLTRGDKGVTLWHKGERHDIEAPPMRQVDPTGAGDVFAAAFIVCLGETDDALDAARFGLTAAAISVTGPGLDAIATRTQIEAGLAQRERAGVR